MSVYNLKIPRIGINQEKKEDSSNASDAAIENALTSIFGVDLTSGDATLLVREFVQGMTLNGHGHLVARTLTLPAQQRALFYVLNSGSDVIHVVVGTTTIDVAAGALTQFYTDGTVNGLVALGATSSNTAYFGSGAPSTLHNDGDTYYNTAASPYTEYVQDSGAWQAA